MKIEKHHEAFIALSLVPGLGTLKIHKLLRSGFKPEEIFKARKSKLRAVDTIGEATALAILNYKPDGEYEKCLEKTERSGAKIIGYLDSDYPPLLKNTYNPPLLLWIKGEVDALGKKGIAVVGTRNPTAYGRNLTKKITKELTDEGMVIFSGLAYGIDSIAHKTAVENKGVTVGVLGSGIDWIYPAENKGLVQKIIETGGAVITEYPPGTKPDAGNFPERNRIVSGLAAGTVVVESGVQGGSMITARLALDQNREVFAVPHPIDSASGTGCNYLIKTSQAKLVQHVNDILEEIGESRISGQEEKAKHQAPDISSLSESQRAVCEALTEKPLHIDELAEKVGIPTNSVLVELLQLEMEGWIRQKTGKIFERV